MEKRNRLHSFRLSIIERRGLESTVCFIPVDFSIGVLPLNKGCTFATPLRKLLDCCGVRLDGDERSDSFRIFPDRVGPESFVGKICLESVAYYASSCLQLPFHPSWHTEKRYDVTPPSDGEVGRNRGELAHTAFWTDAVQRRRIYENVISLLSFYKLSRKAPILSIITTKTFTSLLKSRQEQVFPRLEKNYASALVECISKTCFLQLSMIIFAFGPRKISPQYSHSTNIARKEWSSWNDINLVRE